MKQADKLYEWKSDFMAMGVQGSQSPELIENKESKDRFFSSQS